MTPSQDSQGRYIAPGESRTAADVASAARTATANGTAFDTSDLDSIQATLTCTARSGTNPTLDVILQTTVDGTNYDTVGSFDQLTNTGAEARVFGPLGPTSRWRWTIGGTDTPSFTFSIASTVDRDG